MGGGAPCNASPGQLSMVGGILQLVEDSQVLREVGDNQGHLLAGGNQLLKEWDQGDN